MIDRKALAEALRVLGTTERAEHSNNWKGVWKWLAGPSGTPQSVADYVANQYERAVQRQQS